MITGDFLAMSLTTDKVRPSKMPNSWQIGRITAAGVIFGVCFLAFSITILAVGEFELHFGIEALQTLSVVGIVFGSQATIYVIRGRQHLWGLRPSLLLVLSSVADVLIISTLAVRGIAMAPLPIAAVSYTHLDVYKRQGSRRAMQEPRSWLLRGPRPRRLRAYAFPESTR